MTTSGQQAIKLSVTIMTYNEEHNIERALASVKPLADDLLVVDSFSTDRTVAIAESMGARVIKHAFEGHVEQQNYATSQARYDHVMFIDADEAVDETLQQQIMAIKNNWQYDGYIFNRVNHYCGAFVRHGSWHPEWRLRLWHRPKGKHGGVTPHNKVVMQPGATLKKVKGELLHYRYATIEEHIRQMNYFSDLSAKQALMRGKKATWFKIIISPAWRFFKDYFIKHGFMAGWRGLAICTISAWEPFMKYIKMYRIQQENKA